MHADVKFWIDEIDELLRREDDPQVVRALIDRRQDLAPAGTIQAVDNVLRHAETLSRVQIDTLLDIRLRAMGEGRI